MNKHSVIEPVIRFHQKDQDIFIGWLPSSVLGEWTKVWDINSEPKEGYQRPPVAGRFREFARYLSGSEGYVTPIIINGRGHWNFVPDERGPNLGRLEISGVGSILDGQHRRGGLMQAFEQEREDIPVPFLAYNDLHEKVEIDLFDIINSTAKPLSKSLIDYNQRERDLNVQVALRLDQQKDSPLFEQLSYSGSRAGTRRITLEGIRRAMEPIFKAGKLSALPLDQRTGLMKAYFRAVSEVWPAEWADTKGYKLRELTGMAALSMVAGDILVDAYDSDTGRLNYDKLRGLLERALATDWSKKGEYTGQSGFGGAAVIAKDIAAAIWHKAE